MLIPVILSGGAGTRLWPVSREGHPKPFMKLADGESLLLKTYRRAAAVVNDDAESQRGEVLTVTNRDYYFMSKDEFACADLGERHAGVFMLEPSGRNTAPAVAMAAHHVADKYGRDALMLVLAADHLVQDQQGFTAAVASATVLARQDKLVTFGIVPTCADTGFGYIEAGDRIGDGRVALRFVEKPDAAKAAEYVAAGNYLWNSGMFCFKAGVILDEMARHAPDVAAAAEACWASLQADKASTSMLEIPADSFQKMPDISIDYAVMERSSNVAVVPSSFGWSDIGSWGAVRDLVAPDQDSNRAVGDAIFVDSRNTYVQSQDRVVAAVGVADLMIIDTPDALLVAHPDRAQDVKQVVARLKKQNHEAYKLHRTVSRPWGTYTVLEEGPRFKIKRIEVKPGASLSLQMHHHRSEHWIVVSGMAKVVNGEQEIFVRTNESTYIPAGHKHRLENPGVLDLVMIEVQSGEYLGEDDIVRFQDVYGRA
ncbi:mannose-1-phosphate guanylyltransferase/mannose-6-phosphate isomerase [Burkholderia multivorans]|uniref:mannose-1-phosphate guanylyltransferase/mannose-6-phosphate isomerase n=1 Tax=Burkholderia multivorans TaxID=87883 RepID=UPI0009E0C8E9|nr:mannose-1-phosphate guanylyltransferase/mannose-6-phosphate isomerase [Burkholderia multivorans]MCA8503934.1 mannose-1-phosphate guanylyltransferase/mannose-6-phosphate isomerase [Burkholderia multivorans]MDN8082798.1 mannose-1-phosphate guanylyltransferase/mannose-6-phosphate isomerase [Burkholderia multivorans]SAK29469.1 mannose-1-phosphate guanylyltransferase/mannose-6-phosphate isomerase [Burkholderia multivorans]SAK33689.1 mannose-1-phosphate guanylyltransferase/mannose-6-phosphate isom